MRRNHTSPGLEAIVSFIPRPGVGTLVLSEIVARAEEHFRDITSREVVLDGPGPYALITFKIRWRLPTDIKKWFRQFPEIHHISVTVA